MQRAFAPVTTGRPGSVVIALPMDVQAEAAEVLPACPAGGPPAGAAPTCRLRTAAGAR